MNPLNTFNSYYFIFLLDPKWPLQVLDIFYLTLMYSFNLNFITSLFFFYWLGPKQTPCQYPGFYNCFFFKCCWAQMDPLNTVNSIVAIFFIFFCCQAQMDPLNTVNSIHSIQLRRELKCFSLMKFKTLLGSFFIIVV